MNDTETKIAALKELVRIATHTAEKAEVAEKTALTTYQRLKELQDNARETEIAAQTAEIAARNVYDEAKAASTTLAAVTIAETEKEAWTAYDCAKKVLKLANKSYIGAQTAEGEAKSVFETNSTASLSANSAKEKALDMLNSFTQKQK